MTLLTSNLNFQKRFDAKIFKEIIFCWELLILVFNWNEIFFDIRLKRRVGKISDIFFVSSISLKKHTHDVIRILRSFQLISYQFNFQNNIAINN